MIGVRQIIINGFGHADHAHLEAAPDRLQVDFVGGVLRVVAPRVKEEADVMRLENLEQPLHVPGGRLRFLFEINLVTACAQRRAGGVLEAFDRGGFFPPQINQLFLEDAENSIQTAVNPLNAGMRAGFLNDARQAGVDDRRRTSRLPNQKIS